MSSKSTTFVDACLKGDALGVDIDDWIDAWHDTDFGPDEPTLDEFLGFTPDEGKLWLERPNSLGVIVAAHKARKTVAEILDSQHSYELAARSVSPEDAKQVLHWLISRGRIAPKS